MPQVTLAAAGTPHNLHALINAVSNCPTSCARLQLQFPSTDYGVDYAANTGEAALEAGAKLDGNYRRLVEMEARARAEMISFCVGAGIEYVDAGPALREAVKAGGQIYPTSLDGHPNARAYQLIAATVSESLSRPGR